MIKRILVALDPVKDTRIATRYAKELAQRYDGEVSGLAVVDTRGISKEVGPGGAVGAMYYAEKLRDQITTESREAALKLLETFQSDLDADGVSHAEQVREGVPARRIVEDTKYHDVLVVGRDPHFYYPNPDKKTHTLAQIVKDGIAPTLIVPDTYRQVAKAVVAYDGSAASARTLQRYAQLKPFGRETDLEVVHVRGRSGEDAQRESDLLLMLATSYLKAHEFERVHASSLQSDAPGDGILSHAQSVGADLIVAGAHSVSAIKRIAFGSTTRHLLDQCELPFFIYH
ncbi:MAG: universal stress protein [Rhodothermales bacterium]